MTRRTMKEICADIESTSRPKKIGNNTVCYLRKRDGARVTRLHLTDIIAVHPDGRIVLDRYGASISLISTVYRLWDPNLAEVPPTGPDDLMQQQARKLIEKHCYLTLRLSR